MLPDGLLFIFSVNVGCELTPIDPVGEEDFSAIAGKEM